MPGFFMSIFRLLSASAGVGFEPGANARRPTRDEFRGRAVNFAGAATLPDARSCRPFDALFTAST
jgi:hypothetical protein